MKKSKIKQERLKISSPYSSISHKTERTGVAVMMHWMRELIEKKGIELGLPDVETSAKDRKMPDTVIYESRRSQNILCVIEAKPPYFDVFDEQELKEPARQKAVERKAKYFALTNFKRLVWFNTEKVNAARPEEEQIVEKYFLSELENLDDMEQTRYSETIKRGLDEFLRRLHSVHSGKEPEPKYAIDEFLIFRLQEKIKVLSTYYKRIIEDQAHKDEAFAKQITGWFADQGWDFGWRPEDFEKAALQTAYLLVNKILFYNLLQARRPQDLDPLEIPQGLTKGSMLQSTLQAYFSQVLKIDYETIYTTDFIDSIAFPDVNEVVKEIKDLVNVLRKYDFSKIGFDIIGRIFERLIPHQERHNLGQYFTSPDVVDFILRFCLHHEDDKILDPSCGAGTFLVRAYQHKKLMNQRKSHESILETLWGNDIAKFPAHLATINLAINDLAVDRNYPNVLREDFFSLLVGSAGFDPEKWRKARARTLGLEERDIIYPRWFDSVVGNPPYTRQEEIPKIGVDKENLIENALKIDNKKIAEISKRAGIHAYFFVHGSKFLRDGGYFGFIVSDSWLDVDYGKGLQEFFLKTHKIIAVIGSKVERWFEEADINTCIIILQKCHNETERNENIVRFVYLKKPLRYFVPPAQDMWEKQLERLDAIDKLRRTILAHNSFYENDELRIFPKTQQELWAEGFDPEERAYTGAKWGKYLRAPAIYFRILEKCKGRLVPLKEVAKVRRGHTTGANEFFYLTEQDIKKRQIEKEFWMHRDEKGRLVPNKVLVKANELDSPIIQSPKLDNVVLFIRKNQNKLQRKKILTYIKHGERLKFHENPTCQSREPGKRWYDLGDNIDDIIAFPERVRQRYIVFLNPEMVSLNKNLYGVEPRNPKYAWHYATILNSSLTPLFAELLSRQPGGGGGPLDIDVSVAKEILVPTIDLMKTYIKRIEKIPLLKRKSETIFAEIGASAAEGVSLNKVKPDRRELDRIIMEEILGLTDQEQLEVYRAVVDLAKSRIEKAGSVAQKRKTGGGIDFDALKNVIIKRIKEEPRR